MKHILKLAAALLFGALLALPATADEAADAGAIRHLMMATFDKPEAPLTADPVSVQGDIAVAG